jgi:hypothetical protein
VLRRRKEDTPRGLIAGSLCASQLNSRYGGVALSVGGHPRFLINKDGYS